MRLRSRAREVNAFPTTVQLFSINKRQLLYDNNATNHKGQNGAFARHAFVRILSRANFVSAMDQMKFIADQDAHLLSDEIYINFGEGGGEGEERPIHRRRRRLLLPRENFAYTR